MRRRPRLLVDAFSRVFGGSRASAPGTSDERSPAVAGTALGPLRNAMDGPLLWRRDRAFGTRWSLFAGDRPLGWLNAGGWRQFDGATSEGAWKLAYGWRHVLRVTRTNAGEPSVTFHPAFWSGGRLERRGLENFAWKSAGFGAGRWRIETEDGRVLVGVEATGWWRPNLSIEVHEAARDLPDLSELLLLTVVLRILARQRSHHAH